MNNRKNLLRLLLFVSLSFVAVILNGQTVSKTFKKREFDIRINIFHL